MKFTPFNLEEWFDRYEHQVDYMLGSSSCAGWTLEELFELTGETIDFPSQSTTATPVPGTPELREAIATWYKNSTPDDVLVTCSSTEAIFLIANTFLEPGDSVVSMFPVYPSLYQLAADLGAEVRRWHLRHENQFEPDFDELESLVDYSTKLIILNNPQNPTGITLNDEELKQVLNIADRVGAKVFVDEVFRGITVKGNPLTPSICDIDQSSIAIGAM
ncbi:MAG: aminotransferase class I/II-fold pyridoxal phosphate-dependent enzyme [Bacteroidetes bacterium]|nr:aminotransferase class I/II-fold pyridoxal phosphate-dependent enzyme [Bacteroidota bacterium]